MIIRSSAKRNKLDLSRFIYGVTTNSFLIGMNVYKTTQKCSNLENQRVVVPWRDGTAQVKPSLVGSHHNPMSANSSSNPSNEQHEDLCPQK